MELKHFAAASSAVPLTAAQDQPVLEAHEKNIITVDGLQFKDLNGNGILDAYEDWRLPADERARDLISRMTLEEKAGLMMIDTLNAEWGGKAGANADDYVNKQNMRRFIFRNTVADNPDSSIGSEMSGAQITAFQAAQFTNTVQEMAEASRLGIPVLFKSNARNHYDHDARFGINVSSGAFSTWPKEGGLAATRDMKLIASFAKVMREEWNSIGLRGMYGYMADLATESRWYRIHETFTEDKDLAIDIITTLIENLQGREIENDSIVLTMKHFPGGGPQLNGLDPHYPYGREQVYTGGAFMDHASVFKAAIDAGLTSIMPYYGIPVGMQDIYKPADDIIYDEDVGVGMAFNKGILEDLLRGEFGFVGNVNSDTGIIGTRAWGLEEYTVPQQIAIAVNAGTDVLSGYHDLSVVLEVIDKDRIAAETNDHAVRGISLERVDLACYRLLLEMFQMGIFEDPYVDPARAERTVGRADFQRLALDAQRKSIVMLENKGLLPFTAEEKPVLYVNNVNAEVVKSYGFKVLDGNAGESAEGADAAFIRLEITNKQMTALKEDGTPWTYADGSEVFTLYGGPIPEEINDISISKMADAESWIMTPSWDVVKSVVDEVGAENVILSINFRQPYVLDEESGVLDMGALFATFGVSDIALMDIITGAFNPQGKLSFALANSIEAIIKQDSDLPGYPEEDTLYPFGYGLSY